MSDFAMKRSALVIATLGAFLTPFMGSAINIALPSIQKEFQMNAVLLSWIATAYLMAAAVSLVPFGRLADIHGRKKIFSAGVILFTVSSFLASVSSSAHMLIACRVLQGVGGGMVFSNGLAILTSVFGPSERGKAIGINSASVYVGLSIGPFLGGFLADRISWRSIFALGVPLGLIILCVLLWKLKGEWAGAKEEKFDSVGSFIYALAIVGIMYGLSLLPTPASLWIILVGVASVLAFIRWETRVKSPVFQLKLFKANRVFAFSNLAALLNYCSTYAVIFLMSLYLQYIKGFGPEMAGVILASQFVVQAGFSPLAGRLSDKIEPRIVATAGMSLTAAGLLVLVSIGSDTPVGFIVASLILIGLGFALFASPNTNAIMSSVEKRFYGVASGSVGTMRLLGQMTGMGIITLVFNVYIGRGEITPLLYPAFLKAFKIAFGIFFVLTVGGIFASMVRGTLRPAVSEPPRVPAPDQENKG